MEVRVKNSYEERLKEFSQTNLLGEEYKNLSKNKKASFEKLNKLFSDLESGENLNYVFKRRYSKTQVDLLKSYILEFPYKSGFDFFSEEIYLFNKQFLRNPDSPKFIKLDVPYISSNRLFEHFFSDSEETYTYSLRRQENSSMFVIDIDRQNQDYPDIFYFKQVQKIIEYFGKPFFLEYSEKSKGYHIYYDYNFIFDKTHLENIETVIKQKFFLKIEIKGKNSMLRLPLSFSYREYSGEYNPDEPFFIKKKSLFENLRTFCYHKKQYPPHYLNRIPGNSLKAESAFVFKVNKPLEEENYFYGAGTRFETQSKIVFKVLRENPDATFVDFAKQCEYYNDGTSKDMKKPFEERKKMLLSIWKWGKQNFDISKTTLKTTKPIDTVTDEAFYEILKGGDEANFFEINNTEYNRIKNILNSGFLRYKPGKTNGKFQERFISHCLDVMNYLLYYEAWRKNKKYSYAEEKFQYLNKGIPFGDKLKNTLANFYKIKNIKKVFFFLEQVGLLTVLQDKKGYVYSYKRKRFVTHYKINSVLFKKKENTRIIIMSNIMKIPYRKESKFINNNFYPSKCPWDRGFTLFPLDYIYNITNFFKKNSSKSYRILDKRLERIRKLRELGKIPDWKLKKIKMTFTSSLFPVKVLF